MDNYQSLNENNNNRLVVDSRLDSDSSFLDSRYEDNEAQITNSKFLRKNKITESFETLLGSRLIINKESNMLIFKPYIIFEILNHLKSATTISTKLEIIEKLQWLINRLYPNSFIIAYKADLKETRTNSTLSFLDQLVDLLIENNRDIAFVGPVLNFIGDMISHSGVKPTNFWYILQQMTYLFKDETTYDGNKFLLMLKLINAFLTKSINDGKMFPQKFFYFNNFSSELKVNGDTLQLKNISIAKGFSVVMWLRIEKINPDASNRKIGDTSTLFYLHTNKFIGFEAVLKKRTIYYRTYNTLDEEETNPNEALVHLADIDYNRWYFLLLTHKPVSFLQKPEVILYLNNDIPIARSYDYPNVSNQKIASVGFFKEFTGEVSNVFMFNDSLSQTSIINDLLNYNFGFYNERNIRIFKDYIEKMNSEKNKSLNELKLFFESLIFMYSPSRTKGSTCKDLFDNVNGELSLISEGNFSGGVCIDHNYASNIGFLGGINLFLPIFDFIFNNKFGTPIVLEEALNILIRIFDNKDYYNFQLKNKDIQFFKYLSNIIEKNSPLIMRSCSLFTKDILDKLIEVGKILIKNDTLSNNTYGKEYFRLILFNPRVFGQFELSLQIELWRKIEYLYKNYMTTMIAICDARHIFEIIMKVYDNDINVYCCETHLKMLCEKRIEDKPQLPYSYSNILLDKISHLLNIIDLILTNRKVISIDQMNQIIPYLACELSPCLHKSVVVTFHKIFVGDNQASSFSLSTTEQYISSFIKNHGIEHLIYLTTISTLDVRYECIKMFDLITQNDVGKKEFPLHITDEFIPFLSTTFFPLKTPLGKNSSILFDNGNLNKSIGSIEPVDKKVQFFEHEIRPKKETRDKLDLISPVPMRDPIQLESVIMHTTSDTKGNIEDEYLIKLLTSNQNKQHLYQNDFYLKKNEMQMKERDNSNSAINPIESTRNSLFVLEEDCWKKIKSTGILTKSLSLPLSYVHNYSNPTNDEYVEKIYNYLIKWLVNRYSTNEEVIQLDDNDNIYFESCLCLIMQLIMYSSNILKQKCLTDLCILTQYNKMNCCAIIKNKYFYQWLLDLLLTYQILLLTDSFKKSNESGIADMIIAQGVKIHTLLIINSIKFEDERAKGIMWTTSFYGFDEKSIPSHQQKQRNFDHSVLFNQLITWMYKVRRIGPLEGKAATILIRTLLTYLIEKFQKNLKSKEPSDKPPLWKSFLSLTLISYELSVMSNFDKKINDKTINFELIEKNEIASEIIQNLNYFFSSSDKESSERKSIENKEINTSARFLKDNILSSANDNQQVTIIELWEDRDLLISLYKCYSEIWNDNFFDVNKNSSLLLDEIKFIQVLITKKIYEATNNPYINELKLLLYSNNYTNAKSEHNKPNNVLRTILNVIMLIIRLSEGMDEITRWIKELKKFILYIIFASESSHIDNSINTTEKISDAFLTHAKEEVSHAVVRVFDFLLEEIKSPRRNEISKDIITEFISCRRTLFIVFSIVIEKILTQINLENNKSKMNTILSYIVNVKNMIIFQPQSSYLYSPLWKVYNEFYITKNNNKLFTLKDIHEFKLNNYMEISNKFALEDWLYAFQENTTVYKVLKEDFSFAYYEKVIMFRLTEADTISLNSDICNKEKEFVNKVYKVISYSIKTSLDVSQQKFLNDIYQMNLRGKLSEYEWYRLKKEFFQWKGKWCNLDDYIKTVTNHQRKQKLANHYSSQFYSFLLIPIYNINNYLPQFSKFNPQKKLFKDIHLELPIIPIHTNNHSQQHQKTERDDSIISNISLSESNYDNVPPATGNTLFRNFPELQIKQKTNKSYMFYANNNFSDFIDKYIDFEKITKYFKLIYESKYNKSIVNINEFFTDELIRNSQEQVTRVFDDVCLIKLVSHKRGRVAINYEGIYFVEYDSNIISDEQHEKCIGALFDDTSLMKKTLYQINHGEVKQLFKRRYYYKKTAVEVFTTSNKSYYFNFQSQQHRDDFIKHSTDGKYPSLKYPITNEAATLTKIAKDWEQWDMSTFELLMLLNNFGGRSFKDLTQYPVFPWIISEYSSETLCISKRKKETLIQQLRDLTKPIGALGSLSRIKVFKQKYLENELIDASDSDGKYFYSSHYSNPFYVTHYLYRLFPYTQCAIELQGEGFDKPARQFFSIPSSFNNCMNEVTDVRELIPQFYYLPEMFQNINNINFGELNNIPLNNCELPKWAKGSYHTFIKRNRQMLENDNVCSKINEWIDLIFGHKQKGKEAKNAMNIFFNFTYEDSVDIDKIKIEHNDEYLSYISKVDFGQTPSQLFIKPFIQRQLKANCKNQNILFEAKDKLKTFNSTSEHINSSTYKSCRKDIINKMSILIKCVKNDKVICVFNNGVVIFLKVDFTPYSESGLFIIKEKECVMPTDYLDKNNPRFKTGLTKRIVDEDDDIMKTIESNQPVVIVKQGKFIIKGGFFDGKILLFQSDKQQSIYIQIDDESRITQLVIDQNENYLILGTSTGRIYIYRIIDTKEITNLLVYHTLLIDHTHAVNYIYLCSKLNILATVSNDKTCNLYTFPLLKLFRVINEDEFSYDYCFISSSPIPSLILYSKSELKFFSYTINGSLIKTITTKNKCLFSPKIINDNYNNDRLIFGTQDGYIVMLFLPDFHEKEYDLKEQNDVLNRPIKCFDVSFDRQSLYYWKLENFNLSVLKYQKERSESEEPTKLNIFDNSLNIE